MENNFKNNFGELNEDSITVLIDDRAQTINLKNLVRIQYVKRQKYHINYLAFLISIYLCFYLLNNTFSYLVQSIISLVTVLLLAASYFFKAFQYRFVIIKKNHLTEIIVSKKISKDAESLAYQINNTAKN
jgi:hypothetical protein